VMTVAIFVTATVASSVTLSGSASPGASHATAGAHQVAR
jgi:hypothetical protein